MEKLRGIVQVDDFTGFKIVRLMQTQLSTMSVNVEKARGLGRLESSEMR